MTHQPETFLTILVEGDVQSLEVHNPGSYAQTIKKGIQCVYMRLSVDTFFDRLREGNNSVSYLKKYVQLLDDHDTMKQTVGQKI